MLANIGSAELSEWMAYERLTGPLGGARGDVQAALIASVIASVNRGKGQRAPTIADFMPRWDRTKVRKTPEELFRMAQMANAALGGSFNSTTP
ncbi:phage tail assembly protein T [Nocardia rhamnosiphila]|uniref:phage tail assembly protein T n=1 Tax=Nocardia rhamnosiphila TaxID=426716 RepID=UPI0006900D5E|nr:DUF4035 domain-containing protein [Nocardia rhamnosiphila]